MKDDYNEEVLNTKLGLAIGSDDFEYKNNKRAEIQMKSKNKSLGLSFPLDLDDDHDDDDESDAKEKNNKTNGDEESSSIEIKEDDNNNNRRKKLRLNIEQSCVLEDCFKQQTTLNMTQKHALAEKLNLKPRQIEVWFQNRRARTKLKQTEVNCVYLKRCSENLKEENSKLKKELEELRSMMIKRVTLCNSCQKIATPPNPNLKL